MEHLHPYWRMQYITTPKPDRRASVFEDIPKAASDKEAYLLFRGRTGYLVMNRFPYAAGHLLAVPYRAVPSLEGLSPDERLELMDLIVLAQRLIGEVLRPDGYNIGFNIGAAAGAGIPSHLHAHIVPRWTGDHNFMPVIGGTHILSESLDALWEKFREALARLHATPASA